jgi:hypothetical protein
VDGIASERVAPLAPVAQQSFATAALVRAMTTGRSASAEPVGVGDIEMTTMCVPKRE